MGQADRFRQLLYREVIRKSPQAIAFSRQIYGVSAEIQSRLEALHISRRRQ